jgi:uncharacterized phiE125 gp8 family phage protein
MVDAMITAKEMRLAQAAETAPVEAQILIILPVADFKTEHRITHSAEDNKITDCIKEAYYRIDGPKGSLNRAILTQTWKGVIDEFDDIIEIPLPVLQSVTQVRYRNTDGDWTVLSTDIYGVSTYGLFGWVYLKTDQIWPELHTEPGSVEITFVAGWGAGADILTKAYGIRKAMKLLAGHFYYNATPTFVEPRLVEVPRKIWFGLEYVLGQYRIRNDPS